MIKFRATVLFLSAYPVIKSTFVYICICIRRKNVSISYKRNHFTVRRGGRRIWLRSICRATMMIYYATVSYICRHLIKGSFKRCTKWLCLPLWLFVMQQVLDGLVSPRFGWPQEKSGQVCKHCKPLFTTGVCVLTGAIFCQLWAASAEFFKQVLKFARKISQSQ